MPSSKTPRTFCVASVGSIALLLSSTSLAQQQPIQAQGFSVERLYGSAPGAGWLVMDDLRMQGELGGVVALTTGYAHDPLRVTDGTNRLSVVSDQAFADFGFAGTYDRWRAYLNMRVPLAVEGQGGTVGNYVFGSPGVDPGSNPDTLSDVRLGLDARVFGHDGDPLRLGAGAQLFVANGNVVGGNRANYDTDGTVRAMGRVLAAGDFGRIVYAGQLGVHIRPLDDSSTPGSPQGTELLFGVASGLRTDLGAQGFGTLIVGPELFGATAFRSVFGTNTTAFEGLMTGRYESPSDSGPQIRMKLGIGAGIDQHFGAPEWRTVFAIELLDHTQRRTPK